MKNIIIFLCCIGLFSACKDEEPTIDPQVNEPLDELILGSWIINDVTKTYYVGSSNIVDYIDTFPTAQGDYIEFSRTQKAIGVFGGIRDTTSYSVNNESKTVNLGGEIYELTTLNESILVFEEKERIDTPYTDYTLRFKRD